ncbi:MAG TPA: hypothetical protein VLY04_25255 [Bryobacteraceae bacterium]|nr:hypothetical protein [Bryobacteraceae bacterium]
MDYSPENKLNELRTRTDRQLIELISARLDRGLTFARMAADEESRRIWASTEEFLRRAEKARSDASAWMPLLAKAAELDRRRLELKLVQLCDLLQHANQGMQVQTACS